MNALTKPCLYDLGIKLLKLVNTPLKIRFLKTKMVNLQFFLQILTSKIQKLSKTQDGSYAAKVRNCLSSSLSHYKLYQLAKINH